MEEDLHPPELEAMLEELERAIERFQAALQADRFPEAYARANDTQKLRQEIRTRFGRRGEVALGEPGMAELSDHEGLPVPLPRWPLPRWRSPAAPEPPPLGPGLVDELRLALATQAAIREARSRARQAARALAQRTEALAVGQASQLGRCPWCQKLVMGSVPTEAWIGPRGERWHRRCFDRAEDL